MSYRQFSADNNNGPNKAEGKEESTEAAAPKIEVAAQETVPEAESKSDGKFKDTAEGAEGTKIRLKPRKPKRGPSLSLQS